MDPPRWQRLQQLFEAALAQQPGARASFLDQACAGDTALRRELDILLRGHECDDALVQDAIGAAAARLVAAQSDARIGQRLGPWRITAHLADGGMGSVYRAERADGQYAQQVAVKLLNPAFVSDAARARLESERQILARLAHPHIARLLDGGRTVDGAPYLVMEYVDGEPIDAWCQRRGLTTPERLRLFIQVCHAVDHAHRNLIVHRDLKPGNILVDAAGIPRLLDFGIAKLLDKGAADITRLGERMLTPSHASPEQIAGGAVTTATDVYALGVLLYELLVGRAPHGGADTSPAALARAILETEPPPPSRAVADGSNPRVATARERGEPLTAERLARELAGDLDNIVSMALRKEPDRRYRSAAALADDIERFLAHQPVHARPVTLAYRTRKLMSRHPVAVPVSAAAVVLVLGGSAGFAWQLDHERRVARLEALRAGRVAEFMAGVFRVADPQESAGEQVSARELLDRAGERIGRDLQDEPKTQAALRESIAAAYDGLGLYPAAREQVEQALALSERYAGVDSPDAARQRAMLGDLLMKMGRHDEAVQLLQQALAAQVRRETTPSLDRVRTLHALGDALWRQGADYAAASQSLLEAVAAAEAFGTPADAERAAAMTTLSDLLSFRGDQSGALEWAERSLALNRRVFGDDHPRTQESHRALAVVELRLSRFAEAVDAFERSLVLARRIYGDEHLRTAYLLANMGNALVKLGQYGRAEAVTREALAVFERRLGPDHPRTAFLTENLANAIIDQGAGRQAEALELYQRSLGKVRRHFGPEHAEVAYSAGNLAGALDRMGRHAEALPLAEEALRVLRVSLGPDAPAVAEAYNKLAGVQFRLGRLDAAADSLARGEATADAAGVGPVDATRQSQLALRGQFELHQGRPAAAEPWLRRALDMQRKLQTAGGPLLAQAELELGECLLLLGRLDEAEGLLVSARLGFAPALAADDPLAQRAHDALADLHRRRGPDERAAGPGGDAVPREPREPRQ